MISQIFYKQRSLFKLYYFSNVRKLVILDFLFIIIGLYSCLNKHVSKKGMNADSQRTMVDTVILPQPYSTKSSLNFCKVLGWKHGLKPIAPPGFVVTKFAEDIRSARWIYILPNGDVLVSQANL